MLTLRQDICTSTPNQLATSTDNNLHELSHDELSNDQFVLIG